MLPQAKEDQRLLVNHQKLGEKHGTDSPSHPSEGTSPADTLISNSGLQNYETINFCCLRPQVCGTLSALAN